MSWYVVVHEWEHPGGYLTWDTASSIHESRAGAENALSYCRGMQQRDRPGSEGRYFIAFLADADLGGPNTPSTAPLTPEQPPADHGDGSGAGGRSGGEGA